LTRTIHIRYSNAREAISLQGTTNCQARTKKSKRRRSRHSLSNRGLVPKILGLALKRKAAAAVVLPANYQIREAVAMARLKRTQIKYRKNLTWMKK
jgi:hypothetical protein